MYAPHSSKKAIRRKTRFHLSNSHHLEILSLLFRGVIAIKDYKTNNKWAFGPKEIKSLKMPPELSFDFLLFSPEKQNITLDEVFEALASLFSVKSTL